MIQRFIIWFLLLIPCYNTYASNNELKDSIYQVMEQYEIHHQDIVYAQIIWETGHFKSKLFKTKNNILGLKSKKGYYKFNHWSECLKMYKEKIQSRYKEGEDYYRFLKRIHYARDPNYIKHLKQLIKTITKNLK